MTGLARAHAVAVAIALASPGSYAHASPTTKLASFLDGDAAVALRVDLGHLEEAIELYRTSGIAGASETVFMASALSAAILGFDPSTRNGWLAAGFDPRAPILAGLGAIDEAAALRIYRGPRQPRTATFWRGRIVLSIHDHARARASLGKLAKLLPELHQVEAGKGAALLRSLGGKANSGKVLVTELARAGVLSAGRLPVGDQLLFTHTVGDVAIIDFIGGFATSLSWRKDRAAILALLARRPGKKGLTSRLGSGAARRLTEPGIVLWVDPNRLLVTREAIRRDRSLRSARARHTGPPAAALQPQLCAQFAEIANHGPLADLALVTRISPRTAIATAHIETTLAWGLRPAYRLAAAFLARRDGLIDVRAAVTSKGAAIAGALYLRSLEPLRALPRPELIDKGRADLLLAMDKCGVAATTVLLAWGWPQLLASRIDAIAAVHAGAATLVASTRNAVFAIDRVGLDLAGLSAGLAISFAPGASSLIDGYLDHVFGAGQRHPRAQRPYTSWGHGHIRPYAMSSPGLRIYGAVVDPSALPWFLALPAGKPQPASAVIAELIANPHSIISGLATGSGSGAELARRLLPFSKLTELFESSLAIDGDQLTATSIWRLR